MPLGLNNLELLRYFKQPEGAFGKSVQREWQFYGMFIFNPFSSRTRAVASSPLTQSMVLGELNNDFPPIIQPFHILDVTIPTYNFKREIMMYGQVPRSFPVLEFEGFNLDVVLEEDEKGTVDYFINWNQRKVIDRDGYYNAPNDTKIGKFILEVQDKMGIPIVYYMFHDIFYLTADDVTYSYAGNGTVKRKVTFGCDRLSTVYTKNNLVAAAVETTVGVGNSI